MRPWLVLSLLVALGASAAAREGALELDVRALSGAPVPGRALVLAVTGARGLEGATLVLGSGRGAELVYPPDADAGGPGRRILVLDPAPESGIEVLRIEGAAEPDAYPPTTLALGQGVRGALVVALLGVEAGGGDPLGVAPATSDEEARDLAWLARAAVEVRVQRVRPDDLRAALPSVDLLVVGSRAAGLAELSGLADAVVGGLVLVVSGPEARDRLAAATPRLAPLTARPEATTPVGAGRIVHLDRVARAPAFEMPRGWLSPRAPLARAPWGLVEPRGAPEPQVSRHGKARERLIVVWILVGVGVVTLVDLLVGSRRVRLMLHLASVGLLVGGLYLPVGGDPLARRAPVETASLVVVTQSRGADEARVDERVRLVSPRATTIDLEGAVGLTPLDLEALAGGRVDSRQGRARLDVAPGRAVWLARRWVATLAAPLEVIETPAGAQVVNRGSVTLECVLVYRGGERFPAVVGPLAPGAMVPLPPADAARGAQLELAWATHVHLPPADLAAGEVAWILPFDPEGLATEIPREIPRRRLGFWVGRVGSR